MLPFSENERILVEQAVGCRGWLLHNAAKISAASITLRSLHNLIVGSCTEDAPNIVILTEALTRDTCRELDDALANLGDFRNGFFDHQQA
ncbi:MAG: hypothetical protein HT579_11880 [Candidatus Accumulibacter similis]|nr:MAG: hypothetical protein HT579_11880 [Candidatus Accumulibacter similis]